MSGSSSSAPLLDATEFWIERGQGPKNVAGVSPGSADSRAKNWARGCLQEFTLRRARQHLGPHIGKLVDLGCGYGDFTALLARLADEVIACDVSPGFVEAARMRLADHPGATVACEDVRRFRLFESADLVYLGSIMTYLEDDDCAALLQAVRARLRLGGLVISRDWCAIHLGRETRNIHPWFSMHRRPRSYARLAAAAGLRVVNWTSSPAIYAEEVAYRTIARGSEAATRWLRWPLRLLFQLVLLPWRRASVTFVMKPV